MTQSHPLLSHLYIQMDELLRPTFFFFDTDNFDVIVFENTNSKHCNVLEVLCDVCRFIEDQSFDCIINCTFKAKPFSAVDEFWS